jgi:hypothetical protein
MIQACPDLGGRIGEQGVAVYVGIDLHHRGNLRKFAEKSGASGRLFSTGFKDPQQSTNLGVVAVVMPDSLVDERASCVARSTEARTQELRRLCLLFADRAQEGDKQTGLGWTR